MTDSRKTISVFRARLANEKDKPWFYFYGDKHLPLSHTFVNFNRSVHSQQCILVAKSIMDRATKKQLRQMFEKLVNLYRIYSLSGLEIEFVDSFSREDRPEGLTVNKYCIKRTNHDAAQWLIQKGHSLVYEFKASGLDKATIDGLMALSKTTS